MIRTNRSTDTKRKLATPVGSANPDNNFDSNDTKKRKNTVTPGAEPSSSLSSSSSSTQRHVIDPVLFEPFEYVNKIPGKDIRGKLISCFQKWIPVPTETMDSIKEIITLLHNASLLIDDIEDNSKLRRGIPVAHAIYGIANTINSANYVYFHALEKTHQLNNPKCVAIFIQELLNLHRGQGHDIYWREQCTCPTEEQYKQMVLDKTGGLFRLAVGLMQCFHTPVESGEESESDFVPLLNLLGYYFQVRDDYLNVSNEAYMQTKSYCEDLTEGKFSFPIIHAVRQFPNDTRLLNILKQRTENYEIKKYAVDYMTLCGSIEYTRTVLANLREELIREIERLGGHAELTALMKYLDAELDVESFGAGTATAGVKAPETVSNSSSGTYLETTFVAANMTSSAASVTTSRISSTNQAGATVILPVSDKQNLAAGGCAAGDGAAGGGAAPNPRMSNGAPMHQQTLSPSRKVSTL